MTDPDDFAALRAALKAGPTPGPWINASPFIFCTLPHPEDKGSHGRGKCKYEFQEWRYESGEIWNAANTGDDGLVAGRWDYEEGGVRLQKDATYIAAANPEVIARLLAELDALRGRVVTLPEPDYYSVSDCDIRPRLMHCRSDVERHLKDLEAIGRQPVPWDGNVQGLYREATVRRIIADASMKAKP